MALSAASREFQFRALFPKLQKPFFCHQRSFAYSSPTRHSPSLLATAKMANSETVTVQETITLSETEQELFATLLAASQHAGSSTVLRCAGGWVRDKLLGKQSMDIDIALDDCSGKDFAERVNQYLRGQGKDQDARIAVIQSNPDQSKHLETARMKINDLWIDFVNLRSETYAQDSRIPTMEFGTAEQDALRRDLTINSLFYNINQGGVEDLTGKGMQDLRQGLIRTPLAAMETFLDVVFALPKETEEQLGPAALTHGHKCTAVMAAAQALVDSLGFKVPAAKGKQQAASAYIIRESVKWRNKDIDMVAQLHEAAPELLAIHEKMVSSPSGEAGDEVKVALGHSIRKLKAHWRLVGSGSREAGDEVKVALGHSIRKLKAHWRLVVMLAPLLRMPSAAPLGSDPEPSPSSKASPPAADPSPDELAKHAEVCKALMSDAEAFGLTDCWQWKPLLGGKQMMPVLGLSKPGPQLGKALAAVMEWQFLHPKGNLGYGGSWMHRVVQRVTLEMRGVCPSAPKLLGLPLNTFSTFPSCQSP
eukprot:gene31440-6618_t